MTLISEAAVAAHLRKGNTRKDTNFWVNRAQGGGEWIALIQNGERGNITCGAKILVLNTGIFV